MKLDDNGTAFFFEGEGKIKYFKIFVDKTFVDLLHKIDTYFY